MKFKLVRRYGNNASAYAVAPIAELVDAKREATNGLAWVESQPEAAAERFGGGGSSS